MPRGWQQRRNTNAYLVIQAQTCELKGHDSLTDSLSDLKPSCGVSVATIVAPSAY
jgi:hypothetical protein